MGNPYKAFQKYVLKNQKLKPMKKIIIILLLALPVLSFAQQEVTWDYPVKPGSEEWKKLSSHQEMVQICQVPNEVLSLLSTKDLANICLNYPLFFTMKAFNNLQLGFNQVSTEFNGFQELYKRNDAGTVLVEIYKEIKPQIIEEKTTPLEKGKHIQNIFFLEFVLSQKGIITKLSTAEIEQLLQESLVKLEEKNQHGFSTFSTQTTPLVMARVLENLNYDKYIEVSAANEKYKYFSNSIILSEKEMIEDIKQMTTLYLSNNK